MKHPAFRVKDILHLDSNLLDQLSKLLLKASKTISFSPHSIEICGSYALGCARLESDIDVNLAAKDWDEQVQWRRLWEDKKHKYDFLCPLQHFMKEFNLRIEVAPCCPDNKKYNVCYDIEEKKIYGRDDGQPVECSLIWHPYKFMFERGKPKIKSARHLRDDFSESVPYWRKKYGDHFIEIEERTDSLFPYRKCLAEVGSELSLFKRTFKNLWPH